MAAQFDIRRGEPGDIQDLARVYADSIRELCKPDYPAHVIEKWQASTAPEDRLSAIEQQSLWVAESDGNIAGFVVALPGEVIALFVSPRFAGCGVGRALADLGIEVARCDWHGPIKLESTLTAAPFYEKLGFVEVGRGFFSHGKTDLQISVVNMMLEP